MYIHTYIYIYIYIYIHTHKCIQMYIYIYIEREIYRGTSGEGRRGRGGGSESREMGGAAGELGRHGLSQNGCMHMIMAVSTLFVTTASTETLNGTILGNFPFRGTKQELHPKSYRFSKNKPHYICSLHKQSRSPHIIHIHVTYTATSVRIDDRFWHTE